MFISRPFVARAKRYSIVRRCDATVKLCVAMAAPTAPTCSGWTADEMYELFLEVDHLVISSYAPVQTDHHPTIWAAIRCAKFSELDPAEVQAEKYWFRLYAMRLVSLAKKGDLTYERAMLTKEEIVRNSNFLRNGQYDPILGDERWR